MKQKKIQKGSSKLSKGQIFKTLARNKLLIQNYLEKIPQSQEDKEFLRRKSSNHKAVRDSK